MLPKRIEINASLQLVIIFYRFYRRGYKILSKSIYIFFFYNAGKDSEQSTIIIGFRLSTYASGSTAVGPIDDLCHIPENMKIAVKVIVDFFKCDRNRI